jgi:hypothetical protein
MGKLRLGDYAQAHTTGKRQKGTLKWAMLVNSEGSALSPDERLLATPPKMPLRWGCWMEGTVQTPHLLSQAATRGQLPADESWLHLGCHKMFSSSKYGSAASKWNSKLITNGLKSQSHLRNSHVEPASSQAAWVWFSSILGSETREGCLQLGGWPHHQFSVMPWICHAPHHGPQSPSLK